MTTIYFVRHAESDTSIHDDFSRPLTEKGLKDCTLVTNFLKDKNINIVLSSPYKRSYDTVLGFAKSIDVQVETIGDFRERKIGDAWLDNFSSFAKMQWEDFLYKLPDGECLFEVQERNINALNAVLEKHQNKNIAIGTHGTALSTIINYYDNTYGYKDFSEIVALMPWVVKMSFEGKTSLKIEKINLFSLD